MHVLQGLKQHEVDSDDDLTRSNSVVFNAFIFMQARSSHIVCYLTGVCSFCLCRRSCRNGQLYCAVLLSTPWTSIADLLR